MKKPALIVGSAPGADALRDASLRAYDRIALNKAWRLRPDFNHHVFLRSLQRGDRPPPSYGARSIGINEYKASLGKAGGAYLCSGSVAMIAGYWAIATLNIRAVAYYGCDLVYVPDDQGRTHFYGEGDTGPIASARLGNDRLWERSIRLFCWGILHNVLIVNASAVRGTALAFPHVPLGLRLNPLQREMRAHPTCHALVRSTGRILAEEMMLRTPIFERRQDLFEADPEAVQRMHECMDLWAALAPEVEAFGAELTARLSQAQPI